MASTAPADVAAELEVGGVESRAHRLDANPDVRLCRTKPTGTRRTNSCAESTRPVSAGGLALCRVHTHAAQPTVLGQILVGRDWRVVGRVHAAALL
jgi:hypothetical protein